MSLVTSNCVNEIADTMSKLQTNCILYGKVDLKGNLNRFSNLRPRGSILSEETIFFLGFLFQIGSGVCLISYSASIITSPL